VDQFSYSLLLTFAACSTSVERDISTLDKPRCCFRSRTPTCTLKEVMDIRDYFEDVITGDVLSRPEVIARLKLLDPVECQSAVQHYRLLSRQTSLVISQAERVATAAARRLVDPPA
jgi:hypothetical protein